jgi:hypothetical protein
MTSLTITGESLTLLLPFHAPVTASYLNGSANRAFLRIVGAGTSFIFSSLSQPRPPAAIAGNRRHFGTVFSHHTLRNSARVTFCVPRVTDAPPPWESDIPRQFLQISGSGTTQSSQSHLEFFFNLNHCYYGHPSSVLTGKLTIIRTPRGQPLPAPRHLRFLLT